MKKIFEDRKVKLAKFQELIKRKPIEAKPVDIPEGVFTQCEQCNSAIYNKDLEQNLDVCPYCGYHFRINAMKRIRYTLDEGSFKELFRNIRSKNPLEMPDYVDKLKKGHRMSKQPEAFISGTGKLYGAAVAFGVLDSYFM